MANPCDWPRLVSRALRYLLILGILNAVLDNVASIINAVSWVLKRQDTPLLIEPASPPIQLWDSHAL